MNNGNEPLIHRYFFGIKGSIKNNIAFLDESTIVYPCGHNIIIHNIETKEQQFIHGYESGSLRGITALSISPTKRYIAIAEQAEKATVNIHDFHTLRRRKTIILSENASNTCVFLTFSGDHKYLLVQSGAPDWHLSLWFWEKAKLLTTVKTSNQSQSCTVTHISFAPMDFTTVCVTGCGLLRFYKFIDSQLRLQATPLKREPGNFLCHAWVTDERVVVASDTGELWLFDQLEFKHILPSTISGSISTSVFFANSIVGLSKGFLCGGANGTVTLYDRTDENREMYKKSRTFKIDGCGSTSIVSLALSPTEDLVVCSLENNQLFSLTLSSSDILKEDAMSFEYVLTSFHAPGVTLSAQITGLDICTRKPLIATCGLDRSVRIWNYIDKTIEIMKYFKDEPLSIAYHPSGLHLVVGFTEKLKAMNILMDDIRVYREINIKSCREVKFSYGGQYFAACNSNVVHIYSTYTGESVGILRGHSNRVNAIAWKKDDRRLLTCGADGSVLIWNVRNAQRVGMGHTQARCSYTDVIFSIDQNNIAYATGGDGCIKEIDLTSGLIRAEVAAGGIAVGALNLGYQPNISGSGNASLPGNATNSSNIASSHAVFQFLYVGTTEKHRPGCIRAYHLPLDKTMSRTTTPSTATSVNQHNPLSVKSSGIDSSAVHTGNGSVQISAMAGIPINASYIEFQVHDLPVTRMKLSFDNQYLFSVGEDGSLCILETKDLASKTSRIAGDVSQGSSTSYNANNLSNGGTSSNMSFAEEILITRSDLEEKSRLMNELKTKVEELTLHNDYQLRLKDLNYKDKIREVSDKFTADLNQDRNQCAVLQQDKIDMEAGYAKTISEMTTQQKSEIIELKATYDSKIQSEKDRFIALDQARGEQTALYEEENVLLVESHTKVLAEMTTDFDEKVANEQQIQTNCANEKTELIEVNEKRKLQLEEDAEIEIDDMKLKYEIKLQEERESTLRLKGENAIMRKKFSALQKDIEDQREEIRSLEEKGKELLENIKALEKDIQGHKKEIREREETIQDKEKRIYDLKKKNQELEKFKFVLDYKIKELRRQIEPREIEINDLKKQIEEMDKELEQYHRSNAALDLMIGELRLKMDGMTKELSTQSELVGLGKLLMKQIQNDIVDCAQFLSIEENTSGLSSKNKQLKQSMIDLNKKYENGAQPNAKEPNTQAEYDRQRGYLEKEVENLKRNILKGMAINDFESHRLHRENASLTIQVNELRREIHSVKLQSKELHQQTANTKTLRGKFHGNNITKEKAHLIQENREQISCLKEHLTKLQQIVLQKDQSKRLGSTLSPRYMMETSNNSFKLPSRNSGAPSKSSSTSDTSHRLPPV